MMKSIVRTTAVALSAIFALAFCSCGGGSTTPAPLAISTPSLPNGTSQTLYSQTVNATGGVGPFTWTISAGALPHNVLLSASATNTVTISGTPDIAAQGIAFTVKVTDSAGQSATKPFTVSIVLEPDTLTVTPASVDFGAQLVGTTSAVQNDILANTGSSAVAITGITLTGADAADFGNSSNCGATLSAGANCTFFATFKPSQLGPRSAAIVVTDNTLGSPHSLSLKGAGANSGPDATLSASSLGFGSQAINTTSSPLSFTVSNYGTTILNIASIATTAHFNEADDCIPTLASGGSCTITVTFTPIATGTVSGTLTVTDNASSNPQTVSVSGTGTGGMCVGAGGVCTSTSQCCTGLACQIRGFQGICR